MFVVFPAVETGAVRRGESGEGWGLVGGLEEGTKYKFSVVAVVIVGAVSMQGNATQPVTITIETTASGELSE